MTSKVSVSAESVYELSSYPARPPHVLNQVGVVLNQAGVGSQDCQPMSRSQLLAYLETENADLRAQAVNLALEIQALHEAT